MRKEKAKNGSFWQVSALPFVALWAGGYAAAWLALWFLVEWLDDIFSLSSTEILVFAISFISLVPALIQVQLVERLLKHRMRGWMLYTLAGTVLTFITYSDSNPTNLRFILTLMSLFVPAALLQAVWLWRRVQAAWLWPLATIAAALVFSLPMRSTEGSSTTLMVLAGLLYGIVQGGVMRYLWLQPKETEKAKIEAAQEMPLEDRAIRLQETNEATPWIHGDEKTQQRDAR